MLIEILLNSPRFQLQGTPLNWLGDAAFERILRGFLKQYSQFEPIYTAFNWQQKKAFVHDLKSASAYVGALTLKQTCIKIESVLEISDTSIDELVSELKSDLVTIKQCLQA